MSEQDDEDVWDPKPVGDEIEDFMSKKYGDFTASTIEEEKNEVTKETTDEEYDFYNLSQSQIADIKHDLELLQDLDRDAAYIDDEMQRYFAKQMDVEELIRIINSNLFGLIDSSLNRELVRLLRTIRAKPMARAKRAKLIIRRDIERQYLRSAPKRGELEGIIAGIAKKLNLKTEHVKTVIRRGNSDRIEVKEFARLIGVSVSTILRWNKAGEIPEGQKYDDTLTWGWFEVHATNHMKKSVIKPDVGVVCELCKPYHF